MAVGLLDKMVPLDKPMQLTLLGISVSDMVKPDGGISSFFAKPPSGEGDKSVPNASQEIPDAKQVWSLSSFEVSCQLLRNDLNQKSRPFPCS